MSNPTKKMYWIEYTTGGPELLVRPFEVVGFEVKIAIWQPLIHGLAGKEIDNIFRDIEKWEPDLVTIWYFGFFNSPNNPTDEPLELIDLCKRIRNKPKLKHTKIIAYFRMKNLLPEKVDEWKNRYDFYSSLPLRIVEHGKIAKRLVGEEPNDIEGVLYYLSGNGDWQTFDQPNPVGVRPGAKGIFNTVPRTRLIDPESRDQYQWVKNGIKANVPTVIAYLFKTPAEWWNGISQAEIDALLEIQNQEKDSSHQFLLGVNSSFLESEQESILKTVEQAYQNGGWQIFLIDHMWAENKWLAFFDNLFYEKDRLEQRTIDYAKLINL